ncbi:MAG: type II secretion system protein [Armatimonadetes bacterium]|nr:type II secretion system protein [Armatimonadota bacterium]
MRRRAAGQCGFTIIEMNAVVAVLLLATAIVVPNLVMIRRSRERDDVMAKLARAPLAALNTAQTSGDPVRMTVAEDALVVEQMPIGGEAQEVSRVSFANWFTLDSQQQAGSQIDQGQWEWWAYPDGRAAEASLTFVDGADVRTLTLTKEGRAYWLRGEPAEKGETEWTAGEIEVRE